VFGAGLATAMASGRLAWSADGRVLKVQNDRDIAVLDPANRGGWWEETVMFAIFSGLCQYAAGTEWTWKLDAAEMLEQVDPQTIKFALRPGIKWSGSYGEVTAEDVKYSYERIANPDTGAVYQLDWDALDNVEVTGTHSGIIHLKRPFPPLFKSTMPHASGLIVCKAAMEANGGTITTDPFATSGPYAIKEWVPRERLVLVRNEAWSGPEVYFDEVRFTPIDDLKTAEIGYEAGDLDVTKVSLSSIEQINAAGDAGTTLDARPALNYMWVGMNLEHPSLQDVRVRRAIQQAIDVPAVLDTAFFGQAVPAHGIIPPPILGYREKNLYPYDPEAAKKLVAEAGAEGLQLRLDTVNDTDRVTMAQVIQAQLAAIGITLEVRPMDGAAFDAQFQESEGEGWKDTQLFIVQFSTAPDPSWVTEWFTCAQVGIYNWQRACIAEFDALNSEAVAETDEAKRAATYRKMQDILEESGAYVFLTHGLNAWVSRSTVKPAWSPDGQWLLLRETTGA
jgi:peptide/nickel transport system substrate-binding protein